MTVLRLALFLLLLYVVWRIVRLVVESGRASAEPSSGANERAEEMVFDPQCRSYFPRSEGVIRGGRFFCSEECARRFLTS